MNSIFSLRSVHEDQEVANFLLGSEYLYAGVGAVSQHSGCSNVRKSEEQCNKTLCAAAICLLSSSTKCMICCPTNDKEGPRLTGFKNPRKVGEERSYWRNFNSALGAYCRRVIL